LFLHGQGHGRAEDIAHFERKKGATRAPKPPPKPKEKQGGGMYLVVSNTSLHRNLSTDRDDFIKWITSACPENYFYVSEQ
jgi:hypothetical protein